MPALPYRNQILLFTVTRVVLNTMYRMVYPFLPVFGRSLRVDLGLLSLAVTLRSVAGCLGPFLAGIADSIGRRAGMLLGLLLFVGGTALVLIRPDFVGFSLCLVLTVIGKYVYDPSIQAFLGDRIPYERRGLVIALTELGWSLGFIAGVPAVGYLIGRAGWTAPFTPLTLLGLGALWIYSRAIPPDPPCRRRQWNLYRTLRPVLAHRPALLGLGMGLMASAANEAVNLVFGIWMEQRFGLKIAGLGAAAAVIGVAELSGESLVGGLTDRLGKRRAIQIGLLGNVAASLLLALMRGSLTGAISGLFLFYFSFEFAVVSMIPLMTEIFPPARATLLALNMAGFSLGRALGAATAPVLYARGIWACAAGSALLNLVSWQLLRRIQPPDGRG